MRESANEKQVGGQHYKNEFQHWDFAIMYGNRYLESQVSKYLTRWRKKNGLQDLEKAEHLFDKLIESAADMSVLPPTLPLSLRSIEHVMTYARANALDNEQVVIIYTVHTWTSIAELRNARTRLEQYVLAERARPQLAEEAGPGYVGQ